MKWQSVLLLGVAAASGCASMDRSKLPVERYVDNTAMATYESVWSIVRFNSGPAAAKVALVYPQPRQGVTVAEASHSSQTAITSNGSSAAEGQTNTTAAQGSSGSSAAQGSSGSSAAQGSTGATVGQGIVESSRAHAGSGSVAQSAMETSVAVRGSTSAQAAQGNLASSAASGHIDARAALGRVTAGKAVSGMDATAQLPHLTVVKAVTPGFVIHGDEVQYTITLRNDGPLDIRNVVVSEILPPDLELLSIKGGTVESAASGMTTQIRVDGEIASGAGIVLTVLTRIR